MLHSSCEKGKKYKNNRNLQILISLLFTHEIDDVLHCETWNLDWSVKRSWMQLAACNPAMDEDPYVDADESVAASEGSGTHRGG
eukprot:1843210-Rhodomonas_salina.1